MPARWRASEGPCGGIGRRARLKIEFRKECWFDSGQGHHASPLREVKIPDVFVEYGDTVTPEAEVIGNIYANPELLAN